MPRVCPNCAAALARYDPPPRYCPRCGQETRVQAPTLREFAQQFGGAYLSTEGALWRTLALLLLRPGELTRRYLAGQRRRYVLPLRLYLTVSLLVLLAVRLQTRVEFQFNHQAIGAAASALRDYSIVSLGTDGPRIGRKDGVFYCRQLPDWVCARARRRIDVDPKSLGDAIDRFRARLVDHVGGALFLLLPAFALGLKLAYLNRRMRYTEHLVFALHLHAAWFIALALAMTNVSGLAALGVFAAPVYAWLALGRVYRDRRGPRLLRVMLVALLYGVTLALALAGLLVVALLF
ncbi:MAG: DUF3667 domain-containing protein [Burkholderiales bacterium]|nr:DUF3667 domain-containing protein [Burkholderiales bacterium]MDE2505050.1 DUF3667 domain-containing protein [Burkholderiales bacterium]